jgi:hypothetical protein
MSRNHTSAVRFLASTAFVLMSIAAGCSNDSTTSARFTQSTTPQAPGLVKLVSGGGSGSRVLVHVLLFGPEQNLDLFAFRFGVAIGNPNLVRLVPQSSYVQTTLIAEAGQTIAVDVDDASNPSIVQVDVAKQGGGTGNGTSAAATAVIDLTFEVQGAGTTTLTLVGLGGTPPKALDSNQAAIGAVTFDVASAGISGVTNGGGY